MKVMVHAPPGASRNYMVSMVELALGSPKEYPISVNAAVHCDKFYELDVRDLLPTNNKWVWNRETCESIRDRIDSHDSIHTIISTHIDADGLNRIKPYFQDFIHIYMYPKDMKEAQAIFLNSFFKFVRGIFKIEMEEGVKIEDTHWYTNIFLHYKGEIDDSITPLNIDKKTFDGISAQWTNNIYKRFVNVEDVESITYFDAVDNIMTHLYRILGTIPDENRNNMLDMQKEYTLRHRYPIEWYQNL